MATKSEYLVPNELLAWLQQKLDVMDELSAVQICSTNYSVDEICKAKKLLNDQLGRMDKCVPHRRGDEKGEKSLQDIINVLKGTDPDDVPTFVAVELRKLPPVTFDHVDVTSLLKDIVVLKKSLAEVSHKFEVSQSTVAELRKEVYELRNLVTRSPETANYANVRSEADVDVSSQASSFASAVSLAVRTSPPAEPAAAVPRTLRAPAPPHPATPQPPPGYAAVAAARPAPSRNVARRPLKPPPAPAVPSSSAAPKPKKAGLQAKEMPRAAATAEASDGFTVVKRKRTKAKQSRNQCGTACSGCTSLRAATPMTALYVSRLHETTDRKAVLDYINERFNTVYKKSSSPMTQFRVSVDPLDSRHQVPFKTYVVGVPSVLLGVFNSPDFWPKGVIFRRFRGSLPRRRNVTPS